MCFGIDVSIPFFDRCSVYLSVAIYDLVPELVGNFEAFPRACESVMVGARYRARVRRISSVAKKSEGRALYSCFGVRIDRKRFEKVRWSRRYKNRSVSRTRNDIESKKVPFPINLPLVRIKKQFHVSCVHRRFVSPYTYTKVATWPKDTASQRVI